MIDNVLSTIGIISDSHIPDRVSDFHPKLIPSLTSLNVDMIIHLGDISSPKVVERLREIAPVKAVRGNRDWLLRASLPLLEKLDLHDVKIALLHGHVNFRHYLNDKVFHLTRGYRFQRYLPRLTKAWPDAKIILFGHTHQPEIRMIDGRLFFNPGSCTTKSMECPNPQFGILRIYPRGNFAVELVELNEYQIEFRGWKRVKTNE